MGYALWAGFGVQSVSKSWPAQLSVERCLACEADVYQGKIALHVVFDFDVL